MTSCSHTDIMRFTAHTSGTPRYTQAETASSAKSGSAPVATPRVAWSKARPRRVSSARTAVATASAPRARLTSKHARIRLSASRSLCRSTDSYIASPTPPHHARRLTFTKDAALREPPVPPGSTRVLPHSSARIPISSGLTFARLASSSAVPPVGVAAAPSSPPARPRHLALCSCARVHASSPSSPSSSSMGDLMITRTNPSRAGRRRSRSRRPRSRRRRDPLTGGQSTPPG